MVNSPYLSLIFPAYNELKSLRSTLPTVRSYLNRQAYSYELIISADGDDGTREYVAELAHGDPRLSVLGSSGRGGKGRAIRQAVERAQGQLIGFADADYKTPIEEIEKIMPWLRQGVDVVIGSRGMDESCIEVPQPFYRRAGSKTF